ncbi:FecR family protein [Sphingomonas gellani]|uniref:FecR family protein n=1 Tax=Sphingomonas gellani TaxID=1166340 RepID=A0A1H8CP57_9SPHN|nr:FecR domain-containing protein [Sphingomonas gellani]SEM97041.1 FecR family protein [Sphingomonas gellani]
MSTATDLEQTAATWLVRREQPGWSDADDAELARWLASDAANKAAYWRLEHGWQQADRLGSRRGGDRSPPSFVPLRRYWSGLAACLLVVASISITVSLFTQRAALTPVRIATAIGMQRHVVLADGSRLVVNTDSALRTAVDRMSRTVWLDQGEAYFEVAHDARHPFVIRAGDRRITVLGTRFSVRRDGDAVRVSVVEGRVRVEGAGPETGTAAIVTAGDVAVARGASLLVVDRSPMVVEEALSWRTGMLTFDRTTLADAATEFNRYNRQKLTIADERAARLRIGGSFQATNVEAFARLLRGAFGLQVRTSSDTIRVES